MPILKGTTNISNLKLGTHEIGKAYLGIHEIFNRDAPVWLVRTYKSWMYSVDGIHFSPLQTYTTGEIDINEGCVIDDYFIMNRNNNANTLIKIPIETTRQGILDLQTINVPTTDGTFCVASDGEKCLVTVGGNDTFDKKVYYSLDGGNTWSSTNVFADAFKVKYIGNGRFWLGLNDVATSSRAGKYWYWDKNNPTTYYYVEYKLPDNSVVDGTFWCRRIENCNGYYYVSVGSAANSSQRGQYRGTTRKGGVKINCEDILPSSNYFLVDITYVYGKYYAILMNARDATNFDTAVNRHLYVSTDGINFSRKNNFFPSNVYSITKANGKLSVYGQTFIGQVSENETLQYTTISDNEYQTGKIVCNKFRKF